ncbi:hypothetical protein BDR04DRAFT_1145002 [Suillus decipiens]|nr:hypothetical protein BDR04DRAFT_1145002 [Suillus decipiens]
MAYKNPQELKWLQKVWSSNLEKAKESKKQKLTGYIARSQELKGSTRSHKQGLCNSGHESITRRLPTFKFFHPSHPNCQQQHAIELTFDLPHHTETEYFMFSLFGFRHLGLKHVTWQKAKAFHDEDIVNSALHVLDLGASTLRVDLKVCDQIGKTMPPMPANIAPSFPKNPEKCRARTSTPDIQQHIVYIMNTTVISNVKQDMVRVF